MQRSPSERKSSRALFVHLARLIAMTRQFASRGVGELSELARSLADAADRCVHGSSTARRKLLFAGLHRAAVAAAIVATLVGTAPTTALAADFYWDPDGTAAGNNVDGTGLGGSGTWDTTSALWWNTTSDVLWPNTAADRAIFTSPFSVVPTASTVTVNTGIIANQLRFLRSGYALTGGDITLSGTTPGLFANFAESATIGSQILGTAGLEMTGGGSIRLTNATNAYTGTTTISNGSLIISNNGALGADASTVVVTGGNRANPGNITNVRGMGGGALVLDGTGGGFTLSRNLSLQGQGPISDRSAALISIGNNTISGTIDSGVAFSGTNISTRITSVAGTLTISNSLNVQGTAATTITSLGGTNQSGVNNFDLTGTLSGTGTLEKAGGGTLFLNPSSSAGFSGTIRLSGSAASGQSTVRITNAGVLGTRTATTTGSVLDMNGGTLEVRMDTPSVLAGGAPANVYQRASSTIFADHAPGSAVINGTVTFGQFAFEVNQTSTFNSRNGYGITFGAAPAQTLTNNSTITTNMGGDLTFTGAFWSQTNTTARTMTIGGSGNTVITGNVTASAAAVDHILTKTGAGSLTITSTGATLDGNVNAQGGAIRITDFRSLNMHTAGSNTGQINIGTTTTAGGLIIGTATAPTAAGLTTSKVVNLAGTTGGASIYANQTGVNGISFNAAAFTATGAGAKTLTLGGTNTADNIINSVIVDSTSATSLAKIGAGTWVLAGANTYTGSTTIQEGTLKLRATAAASDVILSTGTNTIVFSANATTGSAGGILEFRGFSGAVTTETLGALTPTAGPGTVRLVGNGGFAANLTFTSLGATTAASSVNFDTSGALGGLVTLTGQAATTATNLPGTANFQGHLYINGADFATINGSAQVVAPTYAGAGNFQNAAGALVAAVHNKLTGSFTNGAVTVSSLVTNNQTLTLSGNLVVSTGGILQSGGTATIQSDSATPRLINQTGTAATNVAIRVNLSSDILNLGTATNPVNIGSFTTGGLTKNGEGTLVIFGTNAQTGATNINEGTVRLSGTAGRISATSANLVIRQGAILQLDGTTSANATVAALDGAGTITNFNAAAATFTQTGAGTWNGVFQDGTGVLNVTKAGTTGAPVWSGLSTYTGVTTIGGTTGLVTVNTLANGGVASGIGASTSAASNLVFSGSSSGLVYQGSIVDGALTLGSRSATTDRLFTLAGTGATLSSTVSNGNAIVWSNTGAIAHGIVGPQALVFTGTSTGDNTFNPQLTDSGVGANITSVSKTGAGQWNFGNSNNTYTGITAVQEGILGINAAGALATNSPLVLGNAATLGVLQMSGTFERNLAATATAGSGTVTWGAITTGGGGFAAHTTKLTVAIGGIATPTALTWNSGGFVPTGGSLVLGSASSLAETEFRNPIDLAGAARTVTVNDNTNTGADFATMSGVLSNGSFVKAGTGILTLSAANTYAGTTTVSAGTLRVSSLGNSASPGATNVGDSTVGNTDAGAILLGNGTTGAGILQYIGAGETSDRKIRLNATTASNQIHADGSGALVLTNVANDFLAPTGAKTLFLRGSNTAGNMITSVLSNDAGGGTLGITIDGGATWILSGVNTYTGATAVNAGALGIGDNSALSTSAVSLSNSSVFAYGADRTVANAVSQANNTTQGFLGDYSLTFSAGLTSAAAANGWGTNNSIVAGKSLTFNGVTANALTANRTWTIDGTGTTIINGDISSTTGFGVPISKTGDGALQLNGTGGNFNTNNAVIDLDRGILRIGANEVIPHTFAAISSTTTAAVTASAIIPVASTAGLVVGQTFSGTGVTAGTTILSIDSPTQITASAAQTIGSGVTLNFQASGGLTFSPELATTDTATLDLNGFTETVNALTATTDGTVVIDNTSATAATFRFGANDSTVNFGSGTGSYTITDSGAGALSIVKLGTTSTTFNAGVVLSYQGATRVEGGSLTLAGAVNGTNALQVINTGSTLTLNGAITTPSAVTSVTVENGATLSLLNGAGDKLTSLTSLQLGSAAGTNTTLNLNVGDAVVAGDQLNTDRLQLLTGGTLTLFTGNTITFNITDTGLNANQQYVLLDSTAIGGGFFGGGSPHASIAAYVLGATPGGFTSIDLTTNSTTNQIILTTGNLIVGDLFWRGLAGGGTDNTWNANPNNWSQDKANTTVATSNPGQGTDVIFAINSATGAVATTLEQNFKINSLTFEAGTSTPTSVTIGPGAIATNRLEIAPQVATDGVAITTGGPPTVTISAPFRLGAAQTWNVADAASVLTLSGALQGEADVTKTGAGRVVVSAAADPTFNSGVTTDFTINGGTLEIQNAGSLGTIATATWPRSRSTPRGRSISTTRPRARWPTT